MKRLVQISFVLAFTASLSAQTVVLTYENHAYALNRNYVMKATSYTHPGPAGTDRIWDLTVSKEKKSSDGLVTSAVSEDVESRFAHTNYAVNEYGNRFFFQVNENEMLYYGMMNGNGKQNFVYDQPFVKMRFPFAYGNVISGNYQGKYLQSTAEYDVTGSYTVEADGQGKLILPDGVVYDNTLRVKTIRNYRIEMSTPQDYEVITYRWYSQDQRYPVAVVQEVNYEGTQARQLSAQTVYLMSDKLLGPEPGNDEQSPFRMFPNPAKDLVTLEYHFPESGDLMIELYDFSGKRLATLFEGQLPAGPFSREFSLQKYSLSRGQYTVRSVINGEALVETLVVQ